MNPTFAPEASLEIRSLREELDRAQELFEKEKQQIHARHLEEKEIEKQHQAFREEQHRVLVEENKRLEEKFEQMDEKTKHLERAKLDFERKTAELEVCAIRFGSSLFRPSLPLRFRCVSADWSLLLSLFLLLQLLRY